jgi:hypothetical protein
MLVRKAELAGNRESLAGADCRRCQSKLSHGLYCIESIPAPLAYDGFEHT